MLRSFIESENARNKEFHFFSFDEQK
jgi:hypothetical protein